MIERTVLSEGSRSTPRLHLPGRAARSAQFIPFAVTVVGIALMTFIMYLYVLPNSQINQARTRIAQLQTQKAELRRQESMVLQEIARGWDLKTVEIRARQLGMGPVQSAIYLHMPETDGRAASERPRQAASDGSRSTELVEPDFSLSLEAIEKQADRLLNGAVQSVDGFVSRFLGD